LRAVLLGGDGASDALLRQAAASGWPVLTTYGLTEACSQVATQAVGTPPSVAQGSGAPLDGVEVRIGADGEIGVRGPMLASGYYPSGSLPLDADGYLATGDVGRFDDAGRLHVVGRRSEMIVTGGENVQPREVEQVLERHPQLAAVLVGGRPEPRWGQEVVALVVPRVGETPPRAADLEAWVAARLAPYKRPRLYLVGSELPRTAAGKLDRGALVSTAWPRLG
jgi:O-succinylbenzoic acid--CoA ligase